MRKKFIGANWKMNLLFDEAKLLYDNLSLRITPTSSIDIVIFPTSIFLTHFTFQKGLPLGAQDMHFESYGAYTGSISASQLKSISCEYVLIGHSERREQFNEGNALINLKVKSAIANKLNIIFCCGEPLEERKSQSHLNFVYKQLQEGLMGIKEMDLRSLIIAYEPIWAIGSGVVASNLEIEEMHGFIRKSILDWYGPALANSIRIIYGGSCNENNASEIFSIPNVDGGLIGGASLNGDSFEKIINSL
jgi:triosephosphate isomerase (TIM)